MSELGMGDISGFWWGEWSDVWCGGGLGSNSSWVMITCDPSYPSLTSPHPYNPPPPHSKQSGRQIPVKTLKIAFRNFVCCGYKNRPHSDKKRYIITTRTCSVKTWAKIWASHNNCLRICDTIGFFVLNLILSDLAILCRFGLQNLK